MPLAVNWDPVAGREASARFALLGAGKGYVTATHQAAGQFVLQAAFAGEKALAAGYTGLFDSADVQAQAAADGVVLTSQPLPGKPATFGDKASLAVSALVDEDDPSRPTSLAGQGAIFYLAMLRALRMLVNTSRAGTNASPDIALIGQIPDTGEAPATGPFGIPIPGFDADGGEVTLGAFPILGALIVIGVVGAVAAAAYAWIKHDEAVEMVKQSTSLEIEKARLAAQVKLAADLAAQQLAAGQTVNVPDVVRSLGKQELFEQRFGPVIGAVLLLGGVGAAAWAIHKKRTLSREVTA